MAEIEDSNRKSHADISKNPDAENTQCQKNNSKVKISSKSFVLWINILSRLAKSQYSAQIAEELDRARQDVDYHINKMEAAGLIRQKVRSTFAIYVLTKKGKQFFHECMRKQKSSLGVKRLRESGKTNIRVHNFSIKLDILENNAGADFSGELEYRECPKNNWTAKCFKLIDPFEMNVEVTTRNVIVRPSKFFTAPRSFDEDVHNRLCLAKMYVRERFKTKYNIIIDVLKCKILRYEVANPRPDLDDIVKNGVYTIHLDRKEFAGNETNDDPRAWLDGSLGYIEIETNSHPYEELLLESPMRTRRIDIRIAELIPIIRAIAKDLKDVKETILKKPNDLPAQEQPCNSTEKQQSRIVCSTAELSRNESSDQPESFGNDSGTVREQ